MSSREDRTRTLVAEEAADWFVANRQGLGADETRRFAAWLQASPVNVEEYLEVALIARDLREACSDPRQSLDTLLVSVCGEHAAGAERNAALVSSRARHWPMRRWQVAAACIAALGLAGTGALLWHDRQARRGLPPVIAAEHLETQHGRHLSRRLADGSVLQLNTDTAITVRYSRHERQVVIEHGEAAFEVAHQPERPFRVLAGSAQIVALGTRFDVYMQRASTLVTVVEGKVAVGLSPVEGGGESRGNPALVQVGADHQVRVSEDAWPAEPAEVDAEQATSWLRREIVFDHEPLARVAEEFNRYAPTPIEIVTPALRSLQISGVFATDDPEAFLAFLRSLEGVRVEVTPSRIRVSQR